MISVPAAIRASWSKGVSAGRSAAKLAPGWPLLHRQDKRIVGHHLVKPTQRSTYANRLLAFGVGNSRRKARFCLIQPGQPTPTSSDAWRHTLTQSGCSRRARSMRMRWALAMARVMAMNSRIVIRRLSTKSSRRPDIEIEKSRGTGRLQVIKDLGAAFFTLQYPSRFQDRQVPRHSRHLDANHRRKFTHTAFALRQFLDDEQTGRVGQGLMKSGLRCQPRFVDSAHRISRRHLKVEFMTHCK